MITVETRAMAHPNIIAKHKTTLMTTTDPELSKRGDCIVAVSTGLALSDLPIAAKTLARNPETIITIELGIEGQLFKATGKGHPELLYTDNRDMVARKSSYTCGRTLMIYSDKAACDIPLEMVNHLKDPATDIRITLSFRNKNKE